MLLIANSLGNVSPNLMNDSLIPIHSRNLTFLFIFPTKIMELFIFATKIMELFTYGSALLPRILASYFGVFQISRSH